MEERIVDKIEETPFTLEEVYELLLKIISKYMDMKDEDKKIVAHWILGALSHDAFQTFPYLFINAMKGSGKSRLLKLIAFLLDGTYTVNITEAVLFRENVPLMLDEAESLSKKEKRSLRELLNVAYKRGGVVKRAERTRSERIIIKTFPVFRPIAIANIEGMDDVLQDRCITITLEKSFNPVITRRIELFEIDKDIVQFLEWKKNYTKKTSPRFCDYEPNRPQIREGSVVSAVMHMGENIYKYYDAFCYVINTLTTLNNTNNNKTETTLTTLNNKVRIATEGIETEEQYQMFLMLQEIFKTELLGRDLELWLPLFIVAWEIGKENFIELLKIAEKKAKERREIDVLENRDIILVSFLGGLISEYEKGDWIKLGDIVGKFHLIEPEAKWFNAKWLGKALSRNNLIVERRRMSWGVEVKLNFDKIKEKCFRFGFNIDELQEKYKEKMEELREEQKSRWEY